MYFHPQKLTHLTRIVIIEAAITNRARQMVKEADSVIFFQLPFHIVPVSVPSSYFSLPPSPK